MSQSLSQVAVREFSARVKHAYQARGQNLAASVVTIDGVIGSQVDFPKMGYIIAQPGTYQAAANPQDPGFSHVTAQMNPFYADTTWNSLQQLTVNFSTQEQLVKGTVMGFGRRRDQILIDAWAANPGLTIADTVGPDVGLNYEKMLTIINWFDDQEVPNEERYLELSPKGARQLFRDERFINNLFLDQGIMGIGKFTYLPVLGMNVRMLGIMPEGGLPLTGNIRTALAWHSESTGFAVSQDMSIEVNKIPLQHGWLVTGQSQYGSTVIDNKGVIAIQYDETFAPAGPATSRGSAAAKLESALKNSIKV